MTSLYTILPGVVPANVGPQEIGNKAWNLMRMAQVGLPVPSAFVLPTSWCHDIRAEANPALKRSLMEGIEKLETASGLKFGASRRPLLVSVRSGAAVSMPGMMETVLNIGLNMEATEGLIRLTGNPRLAWDSYRRLVQGYAEVVANLPTAPFDALVSDMLRQEELTSERELDHRSLRELTFAMLDCYRKETGIDFPSDPLEQVASAAAAVFLSWGAPKAASYRRLNAISDQAGTAVTIQTMVFGNAGGDSGSGVAFTRNPATGARELYFDFQFNAQGEDVVAGRQQLGANERLALVLPGIWARLNDVAHELETLFRDAQDFEFTVQSGALYLLQARRAKRTDWAALAIAVDMVEEGLITPEEALGRLQGIKLDSVVSTRFAPPVAKTLAVALTAGAGVACGAVALSSEAVRRLSEEGTPAILVRGETTTTDIEGMALAAGILTGSGGRTSHAAVVARQLGKVCLVACPRLEIDLEHRQCQIGDTAVKEGEYLSLDGNTGEIHLGRLNPVTNHPERALAAIAGWRRAAAKEKHAACVEETPDKLPEELRC
jgi:pyruvate, orthophosphate dikinase